MKIFCCELRTGVLMAAVCGMIYSVGVMLGAAVCMSITSGHDKVTKAFMGLLIGLSIINAIINGFLLWFHLRKDASYLMTWMIAEAHLILGYFGTIFAMEKHYGWPYTYAVGLPIMGIMLYFYAVVYYHYKERSKQQSEDGNERLI